MTRKRFSEESALHLLRQIDLDLASGSTVERAIRTAGISEATYYKWRKLYGGMGKSQLRELRAMEKENTRQALRVSVATKMGHAEVLDALYPLFLKHGKPEYLRSDNEPEFIAGDF